MEEKKKFPGWVIPVIIGAVLLGIILFVVAIIFIVKIALNSGTRIFQGSWECNNNVTVTVGNNTFDMYSNQNNYVNSTYVAKEVKIENNYHKLLIDATATKRVLAGKEYTDPYTTQYQLVIDGSNKDEMAMINSKTYSIYKCKRK